MTKLIFSLLLITFTVFAQDKEPIVPLSMNDYKIVIQNPESKQKLTVDFKDKKFTGDLNSKEAYDILKTTLGYELAILRYQVDSLTVVKNYLETKLQEKR